MQKTSANKIITARYEHTCSFGDQTLLDGKTRQPQLLQIAATLKRHLVSASAAVSRLSSLLSATIVTVQCVQLRLPVLVVFVQKEAP